MLEPTFIDSLAKVVTRENVNHIPANVHLDAVDHHFLFEVYQRRGSSFLAFVLHAFDIDALEWLLSTFKGHIDFSICNVNGVTPLEFAIVSWPQTVRLLIEAGAPPLNHFKSLVHFTSIRPLPLHHDAAEAFFKVAGAVNLKRHHKGDGMPAWLVNMFTRYRGYRQSCYDVVVTVLGIQRFRKPITEDRFVLRMIARIIWAARCEQKK